MGKTLTLGRGTEPLLPAEIRMLRRRVLSSAGLERHYTPAQVSELLQLSRRTVLDMVRDGELPGAWKPFANKVRIPASAIDAWQQRRVRMCAAAGEVSFSRDFSNS